MQKMQAKWKLVDKPNIARFSRAENCVSNAFKLNLNGVILRKITHFLKAYFTGYPMVDINKHGGLSMLSYDEKSKNKALSERWSAVL